MRPLSVRVLVIVLLISAALGGGISQAVVSRGAVLPISGWLTGVVLLALAGVLLTLGLPVKRYMDESAERQESPTLLPRRHQLDMPTAYRTVLLARSAALTGAIIAGLFGGQALYILATGTADPVRAVLPTGFAALCALVLGVLGVLVERWGTLPPEDGAGGPGAAREHSG